MPWATCVRVGAVLAAGYKRYRVFPPPPLLILRGGTRLTSSTAPSRRAHNFISRSRVRASARPHGNQSSPLPPTTPPPPLQGVPHLLILHGGIYVNRRSHAAAAPHKRALPSHFPGGTPQAHRHTALGIGPQDCAGNRPSRFPIMNPWVILRNGATRPRFSFPSVSAEIIVLCIKDYFSLHWLGGILFSMELLDYFFFL